MFRRRQLSNFGIHFEGQKNTLFGSIDDLSKIRTFQRWSWHIRVHTGNNQKTENWQEDMKTNFLFRADWLRDRTTARSRNPLTLHSGLPRKIWVAKVSSEV